jgi:hypothetical protein
MTQLVQPATSNSKAPLVFRGLGVLFILAALIAGAVTVALGSAAAGLTGTHGTLTIHSCSVHVDTHLKVKNGRRVTTTDRHVTCNGTYVSDDGTITDAAATVGGETEYASGTQLSAQLTDDAADVAYVIANSSHVAYYTAGFFGAVAGIGLGLFFWLVAPTLDAANGETLGRVWRGRRGLARSVTALLAIGLLGVVVGVVTGLVL